MLTLNDFVLFQIADDLKGHCAIDGGANRIVLIDERDPAIDTTTPTGALAS
jgi:hypothetical protein